jgi:hypothetical protein
MLIDQIRTLTNSKAGLIEKIIYQIQVFASMEMHSTVINSSKEDAKSIVDYFRKEGFTVETSDIEFFPDTVMITISW